MGPVEKRFYQLQRLGPTSSSAGSRRQTPPRASPMTRFAPWRPPPLGRPVSRWLRLCRSRNTTPRTRGAMPSSTSPPTTQRRRLRRRWPTYPAAPSRPRHPCGAISRDVYGRMPRTVGARGPRRGDGGPGQPKKVPFPPPEYVGDNAIHLPANKTEFAKRKTHNACLACPNTKVQYNQSHLACGQHGPTASMEGRAAGQGLGRQKALPSRSAPITRSLGSVGFAPPPVGAGGGRRRRSAAGV